MNNATISPGFISPSLQNVEIVVLSIMLASCIFGNTLTITAISRTRKLRNPSNFLIINLSIYDMLTAICAIPFTLIIINIQYSLNHFPYGKIGCKMLWPITTYVSNCSAFTLCAIAVERYHNISVYKKFTTKVCFTVIAVIHVLAIVTVIPYVIILRYRVKENKGYCYEDWGEQWQKAYTISLFLIQYLLPLTVIAVFYTLAWKKLYKHNKIMIKMTEDYERKLDWQEKDKYQKQPIQDSTSNAQLLRKASIQGSTSNAPLLRKVSIQDSTSRIPLLRRFSIQETLSNVPLLRKISVPDPTSNVPLRRKIAIQDSTSNSTFMKRKSIQDSNSPSFRKHSIRNYIPSAESVRRKSIDDPMYSSPIIRKTSFVDPTLNSPGVRKKSIRDSNSTFLRRSSIQDSMSNSAFLRKKIFQDSLSNSPVFRKISITDNTPNVPLRKISIQDSMSNSPFLRKTSIRDSVPNTESFRRKSIHDFTSKHDSSMFENEKSKRKSCNTERRILNRKESIHKSSSKKTTTYESRETYHEPDGRRTEETDSKTTFERKEGIQSSSGRGCTDSTTTTTYERRILKQKDTIEVKPIENKETTYIYQSSKKVGKRKSTISIHKETYQRKTSTVSRHTTSINSESLLPDIKRFHKSKFRSQAAYIRHRQSVKTLHMFTAVVIVFACFALPNQVSWMLHDFLYLSPIVQDVFIFLTYVSPVANCWIYGGFHKGIRKAYLNTICCDSSCHRSFVRRYSNYISRTISSTSLYDSKQEALFRKRMSSFDHIFEDNAGNWENIKHLYQVDDIEEEDHLGNDETKFYEFADE